MFLAGPPSAGRDGLQCWSDKVTIDGASVAQAQRAFVRFVADLRIPLGTHLLLWFTRGVLEFFTDLVCVMCVELIQL